jgi:hypothetical protein
VGLFASQSCFKKNRIPVLHSKTHRRSPLARSRAPVAYTRKCQARLTWQRCIRLQCSLPWWNLQRQYNLTRGSLFPRRHPPRRPIRPTIVMCASWRTSSMDAKVGLTSRISHCSRTTSPNHQWSNPLPKQKNRQLHGSWGQDDMRGMDDNWKISN